MNGDKFDYQIYKLTTAFFNQYVGQSNTEILLKQGRPYNCLLIETKYEYFICVPYRSEINHNEAYLFRNTTRSQNHKSGLDYSKMLIIDDLSYIDSTPAIVDADEFMETRQNINKIVKQVNEYLDTYIKHIKGENVLRSATFNRKYKYSTLKNFHKILGLK